MDIYSIGNANFSTLILAENIEEAQKLLIEKMEKHHLDLNQCVKFDRMTEGKVINFYVTPKG